MRRIAVFVMSTISGLVLLFGYHTSTNQTTAVAAGGSEGTSSGTSSGSSSGSASSGGTSSGGSSSGGSSSGSGSSGTFTGDAVNTRWGVVQVEITVENGKITDSQAVQYPSDNPKDQEINAYALPILSQEVVAAQGAQIDAVSGATVTSDGYVQSLQSAIDQANL